MSDTVENEVLEEESVTPSEAIVEEDTGPTKAELEAQELTSLKARADSIGLKFHPSIGLKKLKDKVNDQLKKDKSQLAKEAKEAKSLNPQQDIPSTPQTDTHDKPKALSETPAMRKMRLVKKAKRLIRFRLTCMNEAKKKWPAEIFTVANSTVGTIKRAIPFNADSWHCEEMLLNMIQDRKFVTYFEVKGKKGRSYKKTKLIKEFAIEILPPLTQKEIDDLIKRQGLADNLGND